MREHIWKVKKRQERGRESVRITSQNIFRTLAAENSFFLSQTGFIIYNTVCEYQI